MRRRADERRRASRLRIALPVRFEEGDVGVTRDISTVGVFVHTDRLRPVSSSVRLSMTLGEWDSEGGFRLEGDARVVRVDTAGATPGLGLDVAWADIRHLGQRPPAAARPEAARPEAARPDGVPSEGIPPVPG